VKMRFLIDPYAGEVIYARRMEGQPYARDFDADRNSMDSPPIHPRQPFREALVPPGVAPQPEPLREPKVIPAPPEVPTQAQHRSASPPPARVRLEPKPLAPRSVASPAQLHKSTPPAEDASQPAKTARPTNSSPPPAPPMAAHGSSHRAIVPPPGAAPSPPKPAVATASPPVAEPAPAASAPQILSPQQPVSPILGSTHVEAPQTDSPRAVGGAFKPAGG
jgi:hypothetical protein